MTPTTARRIVVASATAAAVIAAVRTIHDGETPHLRIAIGGFLAAGVLAMLADLAPQAAAMLALILLLGSVFTAGELFNAIADLTGTGPPPPPATGPIGSQGPMGAPPATGPIGSQGPIGGR